MTKRKPKRKRTDKERLDFVLEEADSCYIYIGDEENARDLRSRKQVDAAMDAQDGELGVPARG